MPAILLALSTPLSAAPQVFADPAVTCNGLTPCYATIAEAVSNAGPAPAEIGLFPGTYAESVDLSTMGSAIGGSPGDLVVQALDAGGSATDGGVRIDPGTSGGPGTGLGLTTGTAGPFVGNIALRGLAVTSPDATGVGLIVAGNLVIEDFTFEMAAENGLVAVVDGDFTIARGLLTLNDAAGMIATASGQGSISEVVAVRNEGSGIAGSAEMTLALAGIESEFNATGLELAACTTLDLADVELRGNDVDGGLILMGTPACQFMGATAGLPSVESLMSRDGGPSHRSGSRGAGTALNATNLTTLGNGGGGLLVAGPGADISLVDVYAYDNQGIGIGVEAGNGAVALDNVDAEGNRTGLFVLADTVDALRVTANASLAMPPNPPVDGSGLVVASRNAILDDIQADDNPAVGLLLLQPAPGEPVSVDLIGSQFAGNDTGVAALADVPLSFRADTVFVEGHATAGMDLANLGAGELAGVEAVGNAVGLVLNVAQSLRVETSSLQGNYTGVTLAVAPGARAGITCSDFIDNGDGLELGQGNAVDARNNFWGDATGPAHPANPGGTGNPVVDAANGGSGSVGYLPYLAGPATEGDCLAGLPSPIGVPTMGPFGRGLLIALFGVFGLFASAALALQRPR